MSLNFLSIDVEDWFTSGHLRHYVRIDQCILRIEHSIDPILNMLSRKGMKATFFVLGSIARSKPDLIRQIYNQGHEIASHGFSHTPLWQLSSEEFKNEIQLTNKILQDITGEKVKGFRAPYASLDMKTSWALKILEDEGFEYDSSIFPMRTPLYGVPNAPKSIYRITEDNIMKHNPNGKLIEIPFTIWQFGFLKVPCTGGIYGRFLPLPVLKFLLKRIEKKRLLNFYFHPWETDKDIPKIEVPKFNRMVAYYNVNSYLKKIDLITDAFQFSSFEHCLSQTALLK